MTTTETIKYKGHNIIKRTTHFSRPAQNVIEYIVLGEEFTSLTAAKAAVRKYERQ